MAKKVSSEATVIIATPPHSDQKVISRKPIVPSALGTMSPCWIIERSQDGVVDQPPRAGCETPVRMPIRPPAPTIGRSSSGRSVRLVTGVPRISGVQPISL